MKAGQCAESVWDRNSWSNYQCSRSAGYGKDGLYCKQHAKKHPPDDQETVVMWAVQWSISNKLHLARCRVFGVTDKALVVKSADTILGLSPHPKTQYMTVGGDWLFFTTPREAIQWGAERAQRRVDALKRNVAQAEDELDTLTKMLAADDLDAKVDAIQGALRTAPTGPLTLD